VILVSSVGAPIDVKQIPNPTQEEIDELHGNFINSLKDLFYSHRTQAGYPTADLKVI